MAADRDRLCRDYLDRVHDLMTRILDEEAPALDRAAHLVADQIEADRLVRVFGPGGHSNLAAQEVFFRAGGLMHMDAMLDEGTLLSNGALRSMAIERTPGYGRVVVRDRGLGDRDLLVLVNAYGINAALIDAALEARERGVQLIGISSRIHAEQTAPDHPARHPEGHNLHDLVDVAVDTKVPVGDAVMEIEGVAQRAGSSVHIRERLRAELPRSAHRRATGRTGRRPARVAQWKRPRRRRGQRCVSGRVQVPDPSTVTVHNPSKSHELLGRDPATGRSLRVAS